MSIKSFMLTAPLGIMILVLAPPAQADRGTFFALEIDGGTSFPLDVSAAEHPGFAMRFAAGVGGKFTSWELRFYLMAAYSRSDNTFSDRNLTLDRTTNGLLLGPRVVVPVVGYLRWYGEGLLGPSWVSTEIDVAESRAATRVLFAYALSTGLQHRFDRNFSLGLRIELTDETDEDADTAILFITGRDEDPGLRINTSLFATLHF